MAVFLGPLDFVGRVAVDQVRFEGVLQSLADVGVAVDHRVGAALPLLQLVAVVLLNVPGGQILKQELGVALLEVGDDLLLNAVLVGGIGGGLQAGLHHAQPFVHEVGEEDGLPLRALVLTLGQLLAAEGLLHLSAGLLQHGLGPLLVAPHGQVGGTASALSLSVLVVVTQDDVIDPVAFSQMS